LSGVVCVRRGGLGRRAVVRLVDVDRVGAAGRRSQPVAGWPGRAVVVAARRSGRLGAAQAVGVAPGQAPGAVAFVLAAELVTCGGMVARRGPVAHFR
jgi:hypothetical protein